MIGVGFCGCPNSSNVFIIGVYIQALWKNPPTSDSADDAMTCRSILNSTNIVPFLKNLSLVCGVFVRG